MLVRTDDEVYRIDAVWLGPPRATFPWRARYVSYGIGLLSMMMIMFVQRRLGIPLDFFSVAWALVGTVAITRLLGKKITYDRPFGQVVSQFWAEVSGPRARTAVGGGPVRAEHVRVRSTRSRPPSTSRSRSRSRPTPPSTAPVSPVPTGQSPSRTPASVVRAPDRGVSPAGERARPVRTEPDSWASRRSRPVEAAGWRGRTSTKEARRGRA